MNTIIRFGIICSMLLLAVRHLSSIPYLNLYFDDSISNSLRFITIGAVMLFAINHYLKNHNQDKNYRYWKGVVISFCATMLGVILYNFINPMIVFGQFNPILNLPIVVTNGMLMLPVSIILSLIIPATFSSKEKTSSVTNNDDVLDADI